jgi:hypothetical protein
MELNIDNKKIEKLFAEFFGLDSNYIHQCYRKLKDAYNQKLSSFDGGFIPKQKQSWKIGRQFQEQTLNHWENSKLIGVDLPLFFKCPDTKAQTVMLVAQDPLRNRDHFPFPDFKDRDVIIGTPFALHNSRHREEENAKIVFDLVQHIIGKNYHVYVTDRYKVWMKNKTGEGSELLKKEKAIFEQLLRTELDIINPKIIITLGGDANNIIKKLLKNIDLGFNPHHLPFLHPSPTARRWWDERVFQRAEKWSQEKWNREILEYMNNEFDKYLD